MEKRKAKRKKVAKKRAASAPRGQKKAVKKRPSGCKAAKKKKTKAKARARPGKKPGKGSSGGRPRIEIDPELVEQLASIQCTVQEIAEVIGCSKDTLERRFAASIEKGRHQGRASLRRLQWDSARAGKIGMQIWLGKQMLGQKDQVETEARVEFTGLKWRVVDPDDREESEIPTPGE